MSTSFEEIPEFLDIVRTKGFINDNTANARKTACKKFVDILELEDRNVEYVRDNIEVIKARFTNLNKDINGGTVDEYARRVKLVIEDFTAWKSDRSAWERALAAKQTAKPAGDGEKKAKPKADKPKDGASASDPGIKVDPTMRTVEIPLRSGDAKVTFPRDFTMADVKKIAWGLMTYATDFDPEVSSRDPFPMLGQRGDLHDAQ